MMLTFVYEHVNKTRWKQEAKRMCLNGIKYIRKKKMKNKIYLRRRRSDVVTALCASWAMDFLIVEYGTCEIFSLLSIL